MSSVKYTAAAAFRAYMETFANTLMFKLFIKGVTRELIQAHEGVKGHKILTEMILGDIVQKFAAAFAPTADAIDFAPRSLVVYPCKVDLQIFPQEFEATYLAMARKPGFKVNDLPFEAHILERIVAKVAAQIEIALWQAVQAAGTTLNVQFDGFLEIIKDAIVATTLTPVVTGAITASNAVASVEALHTAIASEYEDENLNVFVSPIVFKYYLQDYRVKYGMYNDRNKDADGMSSVALDFAPKTRIVKIPGMGTSQRMVLTPAANLNYGYDMADDMTDVRVVEDHRALDFMLDFKIGAQIGIVDDSILVINDQV